MISKNDKNIIAALDVGTSKIVTLVAEISEDRSIDIIGYGICESKGLKRGIVVDIEATVESIKKSIGEAERTSGYNILSLVTGIAGNHIRSISSTGTVPITNNEVTQDDLDAVLESASAITIPGDQKILHRIPQEYIIDKQDGIRVPIGMSGIRLESRVHIVTGANNAIENIVKCIKKCGRSVQELVLEQIASNESVLTSDEKELGVCLIDIGGGTSDIAVFSNASLEFTSSIAIGGDQVTNDISVALKTSRSNADEIKKFYGCTKPELVNSEEMIEVPGVGERPSKKLSKHRLAEFIKPRYEEIFTLINNEIERSGFEPKIPAGIVLTGGSAKIEGAVDLAEEIFHKQVRIGIPQYVSGASDIVKNPVYSTAVGLLLIAKKDMEINELSNEKSNNFQNFRNLIKKLLMN